MLTQIDPERTEAHGTEPECLEPEETRLPEGASADDPSFVNLCGLDYYERRSRLFNALQTLEKGQELELASDEPDDVQWLRYEVEARLTRRFRWSLPVKVTGKARTTVACP